MRDLNRFRGCLIGGAVGDALGYAVEFSGEAEIFAYYGPKGIVEYERINGVAQISDDTQMTLFTANGLLFGTTRGKMRGVMGAYTDYIALCYKDWLRTQVEEYPLDDETRCAWLTNIPELFSPREPGRTCIQAIMQGANGTLGHPINRSKGCGGVMRVAPIGLYFCDRLVSFEMTDMLGAEVAALTHGHELGYIPAAMLVHIIRSVAENPDVTLLDAILDAKKLTEKLFPHAEHLSEFLALMDRAVALSHSDLSDLEAIHELGEGWVAEEALAIAIYCALKYEHDFEKAVIAAVNHRGDSDSTGAVTGNILGAYLGLDKIPQKFLEGLELKDIIAEIAEDLYHDCQMNEYSTEDDCAWIRKYVKTK